MISVDTWQEILDFESQLARGGKNEHNTAVLLPAETLPAEPSQSPDAQSTIPATPDQPYLPDQPLRPPNKRSAAKCGAS